MNAQEAKELSLKHRESIEEIQKTMIMQQIKSACLAGKCSVSDNWTIYPNAIKYLKELGYKISINMDKSETKIEWE